MKLKSLFPILAFLLFAVGCVVYSGVSSGVYSVVSSDKDAIADFKNYKTYAWLPDKDNSDNILNNQIMRNNIKNYFTHEFVDNYDLTSNTETPDVLMELQVTAVSKVKTDRSPVTKKIPVYSYGYPYPNNDYPDNYYSDHKYYSRQPNPDNYIYYISGYRYQTTYIKHQYDYKKSNITINMIDSKRNELVWTVTAETDIYENESENVQNDIRPAVQQMLKYFPIKQSALTSNK
jgi:hypothetical protein